MKFENEFAFFVRNETRNKTNIKNYSLLNNDFIFEATFKADSKLSSTNEYCVVGRTGYNMGIYAQSNDAVKWCWWEIENDECVYKDVFIYPIDNTIKNKVKVIRKSNKFIVYFNDKLYETKIINNLWNYSDQSICVGVGNPYGEYNSLWFSGDIYEVKIYHSSIEKPENLYLWYDFEKNAHFKTFDKSGNGNHGEIYNSPELIRIKNEEFNKVARPAKII